MSTRDSTSASRRTPFTVQACTPQGPPPPSLRLDRYAGAASGKPARHGERLAGGGCSAAHASWAAKDETSRLSARRMGRGNGEEYSGRADMAGIPRRPVAVQRACLWRRYPPLPSTEVATRARRARSGLGSCHNGLTWTPTVTNGHQRFRGTAGRQPFSSCSEPDVGKRFRLWSRRPTVAASGSRRAATGVRNDRGARRKRGGS
jgi:hypothetical protein